jgi:hypothetical protein
MGDAQVEQAIVRIKENHAETGNAFVLENVKIWRRLAAEFGRRQGWALTSPARHFTVEALIERRPDRGTSHKRGTRMRPGDPLFDHRYCYRETGYPFCAAAVAAHLYDNSADNPGDLPQMATSLGLVLTWPSDFPSWWFPGRTVLALIVPARPRHSLAA